MKFSKKTIKLLKNICFILFFIVIVLLITNYFLNIKIIEGHKPKRRTMESRKKHFLLNISKIKDNDKFCKRMRGRSVTQLMADEQTSWAHLNDYLDNNEEPHLKKKVHKGGVEVSEPITKTDLRDIRHEFRKNLMECKFK